MPASSPRSAEPALRVTFDESMDPAQARRAAELVARASAQGPVVVDLTRVRHVDWHALATLTRALAHQPAGRVTLRGLCDHHLKVLRYLDVQLGPAHSAETFVPPPAPAPGQPAVQA